MTNDEIKTRLNSTISCLMAHPDNEPNSEFADRIDDLIDISDEISERQTIIEAKETTKSEALHISGVSNSVCGVAESRCIWRKPLLYRCDHPHDSECECEHRVN